MCVVSMVGDHYNDKWKQPQWTGIISNVTYDYSQVSKKDFDALKKDVEEMKKVAELVGVNLEDIFPKQ